MGEENDGRTMEFDDEVDFGRTGGRRPENRRFPAAQEMGLMKEGSRGKLGKWMSFGCEGFGIHGEELADSAGNRELTQTLAMVKQRRI